VWATAILASLLIHALAFLVWRGGGSDAGTGSPRRRVLPLPQADRSVEVVRMARAVQGDVPTARPRASIEPPSIVVREIAASSAEPALSRVAPAGAAVAVVAVLGEEPTGGTGLRYQPPIPRSILPNWRLPRAVQGMEILVRVFVHADGRAGRAVELLPPTPDRGFNRRLVKRVQNLEYRPAVRNDVPVDGWAEITFVFCPRRVTATSPPAPAARGSKTCSTPTGSGGP